MEKICWAAQSTTWPIKDCFLEYFPSVLFSLIPIVPISAASTMPLKRLPHHILVGLVVKFFLLCSPNVHLVSLNNPLIFHTVVYSYFLPLPQFLTIILGYKCNKLYSNTVTAATETKLNFSIIKSY